MLKRDVIFEFIPQEHFIRVIAVDVETGREVMMMGSKFVTQDYLKKNAYKKLLYVLEKEGLATLQEDQHYC